MLVSGLHCSNWIKVCFFLIIGLTATSITSFSVSAYAEGSNCPDYCAQCIDRSHDFGCNGTWKGSAKTICVSNDGLSSAITVTVDGCSVRSGDRGVAWSFVKDRGTCQPSCGCDEPNYPGFDHDCMGGCLPVGWGNGHVVVKVTGDRKAFKDFFSSILFTTSACCCGLGPCRNCSVRAEEVGCEYAAYANCGAFGLSPNSSEVKISCTPSNKNYRSSGASFGFIVKWYGKKCADAECGLDHDFWHCYYTARGRIKVRVNERTAFDPFNFQPDVKAGSNIAWLDKIKRIYVDPDAMNCKDEYLYPDLAGEPCQPEWSWNWETDRLNDIYIYNYECDPEFDYGEVDWCCCQNEECCDFDGDGNADCTCSCRSYKAWLKPSTCGGSYHIASETYYRAKVPAWGYDVGNSLPAYMEEAGWESFYNDQYLLLDLDALGQFYFHCTRKSQEEDENGELKRPNCHLISNIEYTTNGQGPNNGTTLWAFEYEQDSDQLEYIYWVGPNNTYDPNQAFVPDNGDEYYEYTWTDNGTTLDVAYHYHDTITSLRQWRVKFDSLGQVTQYSAGDCSGGCGGSGGGFVKYEYFYEDDDRYEGLIKKKSNSDDDVILQNDYTLDVDGMITDPNDQDYIYLPQPLLESQCAIEDPCGLEGGPNTYKLKDWEYDPCNSTALEYTWVDNNTAQLVKYY